MNPIAKLFSKTPSAQEIRLQLKQIERDQRKKRRDLEVLGQNKQEKVKQAIAAKKAGKQEMVRDLFREIRQVEIDNGYLNDDLRRLSLSRTALNSLLRRMDMLEKRKDNRSLQNLIVRFNKSSIQKAIDTAEVDDDTFNGMLEDILGDEELSATRGKVQEDVGFADFDRAIGELAKAEQSGAAEEDWTHLPGELPPPVEKAPDNYPSYGDKGRTKAPDNYPSYGDKAGRIDDLDQEPLEPVFPGKMMEEAEAGAEGGAPAPNPSPTPTPTPTPPDPCEAYCTGVLAPRSRVHG